VGASPPLDIWEEEERPPLLHPVRVPPPPLREGADWLDGLGGGADRRTPTARSRNVILRILDGYWLPGRDTIDPGSLASGARSTKELDIAVILAAIHALGNGSTHTVSRIHNMQANPPAARIPVRCGVCDQSGSPCPSGERPMGRYGRRCLLLRRRVLFLYVGEQPNSASWRPRTAKGLQSGSKGVIAFLENGAGLYARQWRVCRKQFDQAHRRTDFPPGISAWSYAAFIFVRGRQGVLLPGPVNGYYARWDQPRHDGTTSSQGRRNPMPLIKAEAAEARAAGPARAQMGMMMRAPARLAGSRSLSSSSSFPSSWWWCR